MAITPVKDLVAAAKKRVTSLSTDEAAALADRGDGVFVDIRDVRELKREGKVPGAIHAPRGMLEFWIDPESPYHRPELGTEKTLILYCASAWRSALAAQTLLDMGAENVVEMEGGFSAWKAEERPIETKD